MPINCSDEMEFEMQQIQFIVEHKKEMNEVTISKNVQKLSNL